MNIIFVDEDGEHGFSVYMDQKMLGKCGYTSVPLEGAYRFYYDGNGRGVKQQRAEPLPGIFV